MHCALLTVNCATVHTEHCIGSRYIESTNSDLQEMAKVVTQRQLCELGHAEEMGEKIFGQNRNMSYFSGINLKKMQNLICLSC